MSNTVNNSLYFFLLFRFIHLSEEENALSSSDPSHCPSCTRTRATELQELCVMGTAATNNTSGNCAHYNTLQYLGHTLAIGDHVFVNPTAYNFKVS